MILRRLAGLLAGAAVLVAPAFLLSGFQLFQLTMMAIYAVAILGLGLVTGYTGQVSLGHGAFYAIGAYASAILMNDFAWPYWATLPVAGMVCAGFGYLVGFPALRLTGHYLALVTFALAVAVPQILRAHFAERWSGGVQGLVIAPPDVPAGVPLSPDQWLYLFTLVVAAVLFGLARNLLAGRMRLAMVAIRDQPLAAEAAGVNIARIKTRAFALSAGLTGIAGALGAIAVAFVAPDSFAVQLSIALFVGLVVGGASSLAGPVLGAAFVQFVPNLSELVNKNAPGVVYGLLLVAALFLMPRGIAGALRGAWLKWNGRSG
jgi:branched-chain amino acid transport system permease protein